MADSLELYSESLLEGLNDLRVRGILCDVRLLVDGVCIPAHRAVLASCSAYFMAMFTGELSEKEKSDIEIHSIEPEALQLIIDFAYTGNIELTQSNVLHILPAANLLQLTRVKEQCCHFLESQLHPYNCIGISHFAEMHACLDLHYVAQQYTLVHFADVAQHEEYLKLSWNEVIGLLSSDSLVVPSEEVIFHAIEAWTQYNSASSRLIIDYLPKLLACLRLPLLSSGFLSSLLSHKFVLNDRNNFITQIKHAIEYKKNAKLRLDCDRLHSLCLQCVPRPSPKVLYVIGGKNDHFATLDRVEILHPNESWTEEKPLLRQRFECRAVASGGELYVLGGILSKPPDDRTKRCHDNSVEKLNYRTGLWEIVSSMSRGRSAMAVINLRGEICVLGGFDGENYLSSVEKYIPDTDSWVTLAPMTRSRSCFGAAVLDDYIYAAGGYGPPCINSTERYSWQENKWESVAPMFEKRINFGMESLCGFLYVVGGHNGVAYLSSMERYDAHTNQWTRVKGMGNPRTGLGTAVIGEVLHVVGGHSGTTYLNTVQCYDPYSDIWTDGNPMSTCRCSFGLAAV